ncbi:MAG: hypothetical protein EA350_04820 [Gemmatimonadales bacterium]|nr:MAG: hypothetical protein EA350_04820 [Gemmatimonadales bacterium]
MAPSLGRPSRLLPLLLAGGLLVLGPGLPGPLAGPLHVEARQGLTVAESRGGGDPAEGIEGDAPGPGSPRVVQPRVPEWTTFQADELPISPRGAFLRSLVLPGWGHLAVDSPGRAAFYMAAQGGTAWMLGKSILRRGSARRFRDEEIRMVREELQAQGVQSPDSLRAGALGDARVERWQELVDIRGDQVEDWVALGIFLSLLSATDALVAAHMADYPEPLTFDVVPRGGGGGWEMRFRLPLGRPVAGGR